MEIQRNPSDRWSLRDLHMNAHIIQIFNPAGVGISHIVDFEHNHQMDVAISDLHLSVPFIVIFYFAWNQLYCGCWNNLLLSTLVIRVVFQINCSIFLYMKTQSV